jgi:hypothetical protein
MRQQFRSFGSCLIEVEVQGDTYYDPILKGDLPLPAEKRPSTGVPWMRRMMGDAPLGVLLYDRGGLNDETAFHRQVRQLFPEAVILDDEDFLN